VRQRLCAFLAYGLQRRRVESEYLEDSRSYLHCCARDAHSGGPESGIRQQHNDIGIVMGKVAVLSQFLGTTGISAANVRRNQDIRRARVTTRRQPRRVEKLRNTRSPEDLADARYVIARGRLRLKHIHHAFGGALVIKPKHRDIIFNRTNTGGIRRRFGEGQAAGCVRNGSWGRRDRVIGYVRYAQVARGRDSGRAWL
jgi:hypothetical protein